MMEIELPKMHPSQQDMELIDILWRQDVDLGAGREVFDLSYRQKEVELRRQREQEEEKRKQSLQEQEKALLAQLQLDEETGEFVPRTSPAAGELTQANTTTGQIAQNGAFTVEGGAMSFDECMQLLAETFPLDEPTEPASTCLDPSVPSSTDLVMPLDMAVFTQNPLQPDSLDQAWMELLSLPELQCLGMPMQETLEMDGYLSSSPNGEVQDTNYNQYLPGMEHLSSGHTEARPTEYINTYDASVNTLVSPNLSQMSLNVPDVGSKFGPEQFCELFHPEMDVKVNSGLTSVETNMTGQSPEIPCDPPVNPTDLHSFSPGNFSSGKPEPLAEFPDSDSGLSLDASPSINSPGKSMHGDGFFGFSDSDSEEMDGSPGSAESDYTEIFPLVQHSDGVQVLLSEKFPAEPRDMKVKNAKIEPAEASGHSKPPFTKDKLKKRSEARLSRDEQRAKALQIPFTVDMIINLAVDDFNEMTSKHQLSEAQLALIRDIRRRGKNKVAAQNCRKRKIENIVGLEYELDSLKEEKERLMKEKRERSASLREMKHQLTTLYQEAFSMLRDEQGRPFSTNDFSLQHTADGTVFLVPRLKKALIENN